MKAVVYQEPCKVTVANMPDPPDAYDKFDKRVDGYIKVLLKP